MKRLYLLLCLGLVAGAFLFQKISEGSGYIYISLGGTSVEMSFWTGVFVLIVVCATLYGIARIIFGLSGILGSGANHFLARRSKRTQKLTAKGLIAFIEGNWKQARANLLKSVKNTEYPLINYLAASRSTYELGNHQEAFSLLHEAEKISPQSGLAIALTQARMFLVGKKYEQCIANLERAKQLAPHHPVVLDLLQQAYTSLSDWRALKALIPELRRNKIRSDAEIDDLEHTMYLSLLDQVAEKAKALPDDKSRQLLEKEWGEIPKAIRINSDITTSYVSQMIKMGDEEGAATFLRRELKRQWNDELILYFGKVKARDTKKQQLTAEGWLKERPGNPFLLLTLGRLCLRNAEWKSARDYFESSLKLRKEPETYAELARLLAHLGEHQLSTDYYQQGLLLTTHSLPKLPMPPLSEKMTMSATG